MQVYRRPSTALLSLVALAMLPRPASAQVTIPEAVISSPVDIDGTGLCMANAISTTPGTDFPQQEALFNGALNAFMETHKQDRVEFVIRTLTDLSNNNSSGQQASFGDFTDVMPPGCGTGGCDFFVNDTSTSFGSRLRGFLNVTDEMASQPVHLGLYADDAISLTFFDKRNSAIPVIIQQPEIGFPTWRITETVMFGEAGLYPVEILYAQFGEHAAIEFSYFIGDFVDFQRPANQVPVTQLDDAGFSLFQPAAFFHTLSGQPSFSNLDQCRQCDRGMINQGNGDCGVGSGLYCNEAALCAPCDTAEFCGPECAPCGGDAPFCININGAQQCAQCLEDANCGPGEFCAPDGQCVSCDRDDACAGNSCNCCPIGPSGNQMTCEVLLTDGPPVCVECTSNDSCATGVCDLLTGHCVDELQQNQSSARCGEDGTACPPEFPFCLPGPFGTACAECRWDPDCPLGNYCLSGVCSPCVEDKRCGLRCTSCGGDTPFCLDGQTPEQSRCVGCTDDSQCPGGTCNRNTFECEAECTVSCDGAAPYCFDNACVECFADTQCPCGGTCDMATLSCSKSCLTNRDCLGNEHCRWNDSGTDKQCELGPLVGDVTCGGTLADTCAIAVGRGASGSSPWRVWLLGLLALALLRRRRSTRGVR